MKVRIERMDSPPKPWDGMPWLQWPVDANGHPVSAQVAVRIGLLRSLDDRPDLFRLVAGDD